MTRLYRNRNTRNSIFFIIPRPIREIFGRFSLLIFIVFAIFTILIFKSKTDLASDLRSKFVDIVTPVLEVIMVPFDIAGDFGDFTSSYLFVHSKNKELETENRKMRFQLANLYQVQKENQQLKELLSYVKELEYEYVSAKVVGNASGPFTRSSLINAGEDNKVMKGQAVVVDGGVVGRIVESGSKSSRILLITDINSKVPVISIDSRERSILSGNNSENPKLIYLPKDSKIKDNEVIVTSGDGETLPAGLMVGKAAKLADGSFEVIPFVTWHHIEYVSVLIAKPNE